MKAQLLIRNTSINITEAAASMAGITGNRSLVKIDMFITNVAIKAVHKHEPDVCLFIRKRNGDYTARSVRMVEYVLAAFELEPNVAHVFEVVSMYSHKVAVLKHTNEPYEVAGSDYDEVVMPKNCMPITAQGNYLFRQFTGQGRWKYGIE